MNNNTIVFSEIFDYEDDFSFLLDENKEINAFGSVTMKKDFGPLKKGQKLKSLWFNMEKGICQFWELEQGHGGKFSFKNNIQSKSVSPFIKGLLELIEKSPHSIHSTSILSLMEEHNLHNFDQFVPIVKACMDCQDHHKIKPLVDEIV